MALHRFPGAPGSDAHLLVVVAGRAARGEGIVQPEAIVARQGIGDVGEAGRALVGGDHEIGIVTVVAHDVGRRCDITARIVVGEIEQAADQRLVAGDAFGLDLLARAIERRPLHIEAALGAHRHDDGVLHHLRLHQAEHFGAEILAPVRPADAAARDLAAAQMNALHARAVDEDLDQWPGRRQLVDGAAVDLYRNPVLRRPIRGGLPEIGPQGAADGIEEAPQDTVLVERGDGLQRRRDSGRNLLAPRLAGIGSGFAQYRVEAGTEEVDEAAGDRGIGRERPLHVILAEGHAGLPQVLGIGAQHGDLAPIEAGAQHQAIEPVVFERTRPQLLDRLDEAQA